MDQLFIIFCYALSFILGMFLTLVLVYKQTHGVLVIDDTGEKTNWSFIVEAPMEEFEKNRLVLFKVKHKSA